MNYLLLTRMLSVFYGERLSTIQKWIQPTETVFQEEEGLLAGTVDHLLSKVKEKKKGVNYFFLFIDESAAVNSKRFFDDSEDHFSTVRSAILDSEYDNDKLALVISSRTLTPPPRVSEGLQWESKLYAFQNS
jgi:hypothetical protein